MKCLLCKGKSSFYIYKNNEEFDLLLGGSSYHTHEKCPRCNGTGVEEYNPYRSKRLKSFIKDYSYFYKKYFTMKNIKPHHEAVLKLL